MRRAVRTATLFLAALLLFSGWSGTAVASETAFLTRDIYLTATPNPVNPPGQMSRSIYLASGNYFWSTITSGNPGTSTRTVPGSSSNRTLYLSEGTYTWACDIVNETGTYRVICSLSRPGVTTAWLSSSSFRLSTAGSYNVQSALTNLDLR